MSNNNAIAKLADVMPGQHIPANFLVRINRNDKQLIVNLPKAFNQRYMDALWDTKTKTLTMAIVESDDASAVKVGITRTPQGQEYYKAIMSANKWVPDMPFISCELHVNWEEKAGCFTANLSKFVEKEDPGQVKQIPVPPPNENFLDYTKMSRDTAIKCIRYLNKFRESSFGEGYRFIVKSEVGTLAMERKDVLE